MTSQTGSKYAGGSKKNFFNPQNEVNSSLRKSSATKRLESRKQKLESQGKVNKNSFYNTRKRNPDHLGNKPTVAQPNSYNRQPSDGGGYKPALPTIGSRG
jgi:hypothetical protein